MRLNPRKRSVEWSPKLNKFISKILINKILINKELISSGQTTATVGGSNKLIDGSADFITDGVVVGDVVGVTVGGITYNLTVTLVESATSLVVSNNVFNTFPLSYAIYKSNILTEAEKVTHSKITLLNNSILTSPSLTYPAYTQESLVGDLFPVTINQPGQVICQYIRYPFDPQWTYTTLSGGEPVFNQSNPSYQDFELTIDDEPTLVMKILQFAGMSIREIQAAQFGQAAEQYEDTKEK